MPHHLNQKAATMAAFLVTGTRRDSNPRRGQRDLWERWRPSARRARGKVRVAHHRIPHAAPLKSKGCHYGSLSCYWHSPGFEPEEGSTRPTGALTPERPWGAKKQCVRIDRSRCLREALDNERRHISWSWYACRKSVTTRLGVALCAQTASIPSSSRTRSR